MRVQRIRNIEEKYNNKRTGKWEYNMEIIVRTKLVMSNGLECKLKKEEFYYLPFETISETDYIAEGRIKRITIIKINKYYEREFTCLDDIKFSKGIPTYDYEWVEKAEKIEVKTGWSDEAEAFFGENYDCEYRTEVAVWSDGLRCTVTNMGLSLDKKYDYFPII